LRVVTLTSLCTLLFPSALLFGQVDEGAITGTVQDPSGAVVPNAQVTLLNTDVGLTLETVTNSSGSYTFSPVRIGHYTVSATAQGFAKTSQQNLQVTVAQTLQINLQLKPGAATETVQVTSAPPQLQTEEASVGQTVTGRTLNDLPLNGRNFTFLAQLGAGVNTPQADTRGNAASGAFSANGLRPAQNNYLLDGVDNNSNAVDFLNGTNFSVLPPLDAIQEFKVQTADFSAELGRSAGAVVNATIKSGTNSLHGDFWEFFRNDKLDAADYFETKGKGELRQNQFGATAGGPILKNKIFVFGDYEGLRRVQGNTQSGISVPTVAERNSNFTNLSDIITGQGTNSRADALGRQIPIGAILDPATTRPVTAGQVDPVSGLTAGSSGYVRDPFTNGSCAPSTRAYSLSCGLNQLPANRLDPNAIKLLNLYPLPTNNSLTSNFVSSPNLYEHRNAFDTRFDFDLNQKDQVYYRFSWVDDPQYIPGPFGGVADGGGFASGVQTARSNQSALAWTHVFSPSTINVARVGFNHLHTTRFGPEGSVMGIPAQYGIQGIPQVSENGGLPAISISGLQTLGSNSYLPSDEISQTLQITDDFTKIWGKHSFKMGIESQRVRFSTLQPAFSRGTFSFNSSNSSISYTDIPNVGGGATGRAQFLLTPIAATVPNGVSYVGGADQIQASNINKTYDARTYFATYFQDDLKLTPKLTLNLGLRWDYFSPINETNGGQANFVQSGPPNNAPTFLIPASGKDLRTLSSTANTPSLNGHGFLDLLAKDGISLESTNKYGQGLVQTQKNNFAPRVGFAYEATSKLVVRGGFGFFFNSFENQGYGPNIGENYPFVYNFTYAQQNLGIPSVTPISVGSPYAGCATAGPGGTGTLNAGFSCIAFSPAIVNAQGIGLQGLQFSYQTPRTLSTNLTFQYAVTPSLSAQVSYVFTQGANLQAGIGDNNVTALLPAGASPAGPVGGGTTGTVPFPDFSHGASYQQTIGRSDYNGLQTRLEQQFSNGLTFLFAYTFSKTLSDAGDLLNGGSVAGYRATAVPGLGPHFDWGLADFNIANVFHFSGGYELPFGKGRQFLANSGKLTDSILGGWNVNWISTLQGGQPITLRCPSSSTAGTNCNDINVPGQSQQLGMHTDSNGKLNWFGNPKAFQQPCPLGATPTPGCVPLSGSAILGDGPATTVGPGVGTFQFSTFKEIPIRESISMEFRAEFFNILNHPTFNAPGFGGNGVVAIPNATNFTSSNFGEIGSTRFAPYDPRQIQFALKLYY
ncbi:MAG TPA: carboxypeptidase-like regulatory domain-containing protein, partial [Acidobacteriaceae bacterium]|nr:carboxypeptidase-like regulatory domain-containing protein [Acidobacteriaceae bacterium]